MHSRPGGLVQVLAGLTVLFSVVLLTRVPSARAQTEAPQPSRVLAADEVARRLGSQLGLDPAGIAVQTQPVDYIRLRALEASVSQHDPPLYVLVEAASGEILDLTYKWPGAGSTGLFPVPEGAARTPALDQAAAQRLASAAIQRCLGGVPKGYELVEDTYNDMHLYRRYVFCWQEVADGVRLPHRIWATVDAVKGRVASLSRLVYPLTVPLEARITQEEAIQRALDRCRPLLLPGETLATPEAVLQVAFAHSTKYPYPHDRQFLMWSMKLSTAGTTPRWVLWVEVDALTGEIVGELWPGGDSGAPAGPTPAAQAHSAPSSRKAEAPSLGMWAGALAAALALAGVLVLLARRRACASAPHHP